MPAIFISTQPFPYIRAASLTELLESYGDSGLKLSAKDLDMKVTAGSGSYTAVLNGTVVLYDATSFMQSPQEYAEAQLTALTHLQEQARNLLTNTQVAERKLMQGLTYLNSHQRHWKKAAITIAKLAYTYLFFIPEGTLNPKVGRQKILSKLEKQARAYESAAAVFSYGYEFFTGLETTAEANDSTKAKLAECARIAHNLSAVYSMIATTNIHNGESASAMIDTLYANNRKI